MIDFISKVWGCFFAWEVKPGIRSWFENADVIITLAFGGLESASNIKLAEITGELAEIYKKPMIMQWEIADHFGTIDASNTFLIRSEEKYLDTFGMLIQAAEICKHNGWRKAIVVAHPDHMWRSMGCVRKLGLHPIPADCRNVPYDKTSTQSWTRSFDDFFWREILARCVYLMRGNI